MTCSPVPLPFALWFRRHDWQFCQLAQMNKPRCWGWCTTPADHCPMLRIPIRVIFRRHDWQSQSCPRIQRSVPGYSEKLVIWQLVYPLWIPSMASAWDLVQFWARCTSSAVFWCMSRKWPQRSFQEHYHQRGSCNSTSSLSQALTRLKELHNEVLITFHKPIRPRQCRHNTHKI